MDIAAAPPALMVQLERYKSKGGRVQKVLNGIELEEFVELPVGPPTTVSGGVVEGDGCWGDGGSDIDGWEVVGGGGRAAVEPVAALDAKATATLPNTPHASSTDQQAGHASRTPGTRSAVPQELVRYRLEAVISHIGHNAHHGHYVADVRADSDSDQFMHMNDGHVAAPAPFDELVERYGALVSCQS
jgi:hypothetical protein